MYRFTFRVMEGSEEWKPIVIAATILQAWEEIRRRYPSWRYPDVCLLSSVSIKTKLDSPTRTKRKKR